MTKSNKEIINANNDSLDIEDEVDLESTMLQWILAEKSTGSDKAVAPADAELITYDDEVDDQDEWVIGG